MTETTCMHRVLEQVDGMREEIVRTLRDAIQIPSVVGNESTAQAFMESLFRSLNLDIDRVEPDIAKIKDHPAFIDTHSSYENRHNVIGTLPGDPSKPSIILNGHIDVVSPEPVSAWTHDPWGAEIVGDTLYGRGAGDMKSGLLANFFALKALLLAGLKPAGNVMLWSVIDEEAGGAGGTLACLAKGLRGDAMICTEPHHLNLTIAHSGISYFRVRVQGKSSHGGMAHLGVNAIGKMIPIYNALMELGEKRGNDLSFELFEKGSGKSCHLSAGTLKAGDWPATVAGEAVMECRISFIPGEKMADIRRLVTDTVEQVAKADDWLREHPPGIEWFGWQTDPWHQDPHHPFIKTLKSSAESVLNRKTDFIGRSSGLDTRFCPYFQIPSACTGPVAHNIHGIDESVSISSVLTLTKVLAVTILSWCGGNN